jgi:phage terminase small subunit
LEAITRDEIVESLIANGTRRDLAVQYADAFIEYREASRNIEANGVIVQHPRTLNPIENPYLQVRDRSLRKLQRFGSIKAQFLW